MIGGGAFVLPWPLVRSAVPSRPLGELDVVFLMFDDIVVKKQGVTVASGPTRVLYRGTQCLYSGSVIQAVA